MRMNSKQLIIKPLVTIIVPVYNCKDYIEECIESILLSTYDNYEIIIVDDGSTDGSNDKCREISNKTNRIQFISQENQGVAVARNIGINLAKGEYLIFVDGDDKIKPDMIQKLVHEASFVGADITCCGYCTYDGKDYVECGFYNQSFVANDIESKEKFMLQLFDANYLQPKLPTVTAIGVPWGKLYKTEFIKDFNLQFLPTLRRMQDNVFNMWSFHYATNIQYIDMPLYVYRTENIYQYQTGKKAISRNNLIEIINQRYEFMNTCGHLYSSMIIGALYMERLYFLAELFKGLILSYSDRSSRVKQFCMECRESYFHDLLEKNVDYPMSTSKAVLSFLYRHGFYRVIYFCIAFHYKIR